MHNDFEHLFERLSDARLRYEDLRVTGGSWVERSDAISQLHALRAEMREIRQALL